MKILIQFTSKLSLANEAAEHGDMHCERKNIVRYKKYFYPVEPYQIFLFAMET